MEFHDIQIRYTNNQRAVTMQGFYYALAEGQLVAPLLNKRRVFCRWHFEPSSVHCKVTRMAEIHSTDCIYGRCIFFLKTFCNLHVNSKTRTHSGTGSHLWHAWYPDNNIFYTIYNNTQTFVFIILV